jgi:hypothetical protein
MEETTTGIEDKAVKLEVRDYRQYRKIYYVS